MEEVRVKQRDNPEYNFLHGGEGAGYFYWVLFNQLTAQPSQPIAAPAPLDPVAQLPPEVATGWSQVLDVLNGSRESITSSQGWFMACAPYAVGMATMTARRLQSTNDFPRILHILYLVNDILLKAKSRRNLGMVTAADPIAAAFFPLLGSMLHHAYTMATISPENQQKIFKTVNFWAEKGVYPVATVQGLTQAMTCGTSAAPLPPMTRKGDGVGGEPTPLPSEHLIAGGVVAPSEWTARVPPQPRPPLRADHLSGAFRAKESPLPTVEPEQPCFDPFSFPPGLIPTLVEEKLRTDTPYSPLEAAEIEKCQVLPPPTMDAYLQARLDKFYAQLADYRPGMAFSDLEVEPPRKVHHVQAGDDGSGGFVGGNGARGLGYGGSSSHGDANDDIFSSYRRMRSTGYFSSIAKSAAGKFDR